MNEERYHELLGRLLDDELDSTQARQLADWLPQNPDRRSDILQHLMLWDLFSQQCQRERTADAFVEACKTRIVAEADENIFVRETGKKLREAAGKTAGTEGKPAFSFIDWLRRFIPSPRWAVGIAAVLLIGLGVWLFPPVNNEPTLTVSTGTQVTLERGGRSFPAQDPLKLLPGDLLRISGSNGAAIGYGKENTHVMLNDKTELKTLAWQRGKRFELRQGKLEASVARQRPFQPMILITPQAEVRVLGTKFMLTAATNATRLEVAQGKVQLTRTSDSAVVKVAAGHYAVAAANYALAAQPLPGKLLREFWLDLSGDTLQDLIYHARYPNAPSGHDFPASFETNTNWPSAFGTRTRGYVLPPVNGDYEFRISGNGQICLWLSPDDDPINRVKISQIVFTRNRSGDEGRGTASRQESGPITLEAGRRYYIEAAHKYGSGEDRLTLTWKRPDGTQEPIPADFLAPFIVKKKGAK